MAQRPSTRASRVIAALLRIGWSIKRQSGSHRTLQRQGWTDVVFAFHDGDEIGPRMLARTPSTRDSNLKTFDHTNPHRISHPCASFSSVVA